VRVTCASTIATVGRVFASTLPDIGSPGTPALISTAISFLWTLHAFWRGVGQDEILWAAFVGGFIGLGVGFLLYAIGLITGLY
jgi:Flp pilus assembly protein protease CpaA